MEDAVLERDPDRAVIRIQCEQSRRAEPAAEVSERVIRLDDAGSVDARQPALGQDPDGAVRGVDSNPDRRLERHVEQDAVRRGVDLMKAVFVTEP
jgi:hypothetical protein